MATATTPDTAAPAEAPTSEVRVQIALRGEHGRGYFVDLPMDSGMLVADHLAELIPYLVMVLKYEGKDTSWLEDETAHWALKKVLRKRPLEESQSLAQQKIRDGSRLLLVKREAAEGEHYTPLVDDVAESITYWLKKHFTAWDDTIWGQKLSVTLMAIMTGLCSIASIMWTSATNPGLAPRLALVGVMLAIAVIAAAVAIVTIRADRGEYSILCVPLVITSYLFFGTAALIATPRPLGVEQVLIAASTLFWISVLMGWATKRSDTDLNYAVASASLGVMLVAGLNVILRITLGESYFSPTSIVALQLITIAFFEILVAPRVAMALAKMSLPRVPAPGEPYVRRGAPRAGDMDAATATDVELAEGESTRSVFNQEEQILNTYHGIVGLSAGALAILAAAAFFMGSTLSVHPLVMFIYVAVVTVCLIYRGKTNDDARLQAMLLIFGTVTPALFAIGLFTSKSSYNYLLGAITLVIIMFGLLIATVYAVQQRPGPTPIVMRILEFIERALYATPILFVFLAMDLFTKLRNHG